MQEATTYADLATQRHSKRTELAYTDLHGVPCLLILVEKGRMGDTFPQTFQYMDCRIRQASYLLMPTRYLQRYAASSR